MILAALLAGLLLWLSFGTAAFRDRRNWPALAAEFFGLAALATGHLLVGGALIVGGAIWLRRPKTLFARRRAFEQDMDEARARALLGVSPDADREAIVAAHRRLIARNHPDSGGTEALAAQLNAARDLLLGRAAEPSRNDATRSERAEDHP